MNELSSKTILVTGANSGIGFEAAAQLAEAGWGRVILACRTVDKARRAQAFLVERVGSDPFDVLAVDVSSVASANAAVEQLLGRGTPIDALLLNAGMASGDQMNKTDDGLEIAFASSIIGHHILTTRLLEAGALRSGALRSGARIVLAGSEAANGDLPAMMGLTPFDFVFGKTDSFGDTVHDAMVTFARGANPSAWNPTRYYAATKVFSAWWSGAMARRYGTQASFFTVSPGSTLSTNAGRHVTGFKKFLFAKVMPAFGSLFGMDQPVSAAAKRYVDVIDGEGVFRSGHTYTSKKGKLVGPLREVDYPHLLDQARQDVALAVLTELTELTDQEGLRARTG